MYMWLQLRDGFQGCFAESVWRNCGFTHLIKEQLSPLLFPEVHLLHSHLLAAVFLAGDAHDTRGAFADFDKAVQVFPRVACRQTQEFNFNETPET